MKRFPRSKNVFEEFKKLTDINEDCSDTNSGNNDLDISCVENKTEFLDSEESSDEIEVQDIEQSEDSVSEEEILKRARDTENG